MWCGNAQSILINQFPKQCKIIYFPISTRVLNSLNIHEQVFVAFYYVFPKVDKIFSQQYTVYVLLAQSHINNRMCKPHIKGDICNVSCRMKLSSFFQRVKMYCRVYIQRVFFIESGCPLMRGSLYCKVTDCVHYSLKCVCTSMGIF